MNLKTRVEINSQKKIGEINPYIYGQYFEHLEDCIYPSVLDQSSPHANKAGLRQDVMKAAKELSVPMVRWPGGCFADLYHWEDGIGTKEDRPIRQNWHWGGLESNQFGTDEFLQWCKEVGTEPYINFNLGTGTLEEALRWMDYCNGETETADVLMRKENGQIDPYGVQHWGIGNETWGIWEAGKMDAQSYGQKLRNWVEFIKKYDANSKLLAVGSNGGYDSEWDREVLKNAGKFIEYLTIHMYGYSLDRKSGDEYYPVIFSPVYFKQRIQQMLDIIDEYTEASLSTHSIKISMDEWNIRHFEETEENGVRLNRKSPRNLQDALFVAGVLNTMITFSPRVSMANYVFLVNGNGVMNVNAESIVKTPLFYVFQQYGKWMQGEAVEVIINGPTRLTPQPQLIGPDHHKTYEQEEVSYIDAVGSLNEDGSLVISLINRHQEKEIEVELLLPDNFVPKEVWMLNHEDVYAVNDFDTPDKIVPIVEKVDGKLDSWKCPAHSIILLKCRKR